jgi:hypothetical protein
LAWEESISSNISPASSISDASRPGSLLISNSGVSSSMAVPLGKLIFGGGGLDDVELPDLN